MGQWSGFARANYFRVKDLDAFTADLARHGLADDVTIHHGGPSDPEGSITVSPDRTDNGAFPEPSQEDVCDDYTDAAGLCDGCGWPEAAHQAPSESLQWSLPDVVAAHLIDGDVAVFITVGAERVRYLTGRAVAVNNRGEHKIIDLNDIYEAAAPLGDTITAAEY